MAKKHRRFGRLHQTLKDTGYAASSGPGGEYLKFLKGDNKLTVPRKPDAKYLVRFNVGVIPFGNDVSTAANAINAYQTSMTVQADNIRNAFNTTAPDALFGISRDLTKAQEINGFYAATARITVYPTSQTTKDQKTSSITKRAYKAFKTRTGSVPYGRSLSVLDASGAAITDLNKANEEDSRTTILNKLAGQTAGNFKCTGVSFTPETHPEIGFFGHSKSASAAADVPGN